MSYADMTHQEKLKVLEEAWEGDPAPTEWAAAEIKRLSAENERQKRINATVITVRHPALSPGISNMATLMLNAAFSRLGRILPLVPNLGTILLYCRIRTCRRLFSRDSLQFIEQ